MITPHTTSAPLYCKCAFTDPDGTFVPGEPCPIHPNKDTVDAARYRWLRDHPKSSWEIGHTFGRGAHTFVCRVPFHDLDRIPATLDTAIDQAMAHRTDETSNVCPDCHGKGAKTENGIEFCNCDDPKETA